MSLLIFPHEIIQFILSHFSLSFIYNSPFDQSGVLSFLRTSSFLLSLKERENIIDFHTDYEFLNIGRSAYFIPIEGGGGHVHNISQSRSIEILGQETLQGAFCSSTRHGVNTIPNYFIIDLKHFKLQLSHITMSSSFYPEASYLKSTRDIGPTFYGSHVHPSENTCWEIIENEWEPIDLVYIPKFGTNGKSYKYGKGTWKLKTHVHYQYFQVRQVCDLSSKRFGAESKPGEALHSTLSGLEIYGDLIVTSNL